MREEFEKWFEKNLGAHSCQFDKDEDGNYEERETICAWYAYQEQQKKIDKAIEYLDSIEGLVWYEQIKELLK